MDDFKFDAFGLDDAFEASVVAVNVEFELFFKLWAVGVLHCAGFVPLGLLLHTYTHTHTQNDRIKTQRRCRQILHGPPRIGSPCWGKESRTSQWHPDR